MSHLIVDDLQEVDDTAQNRVWANMSQKVKLQPKSFDLPVQ